MMEDIGKDKHVHDLVSKAQMITSFIYGYNRILHMMRECTDGHAIIRPGPTRFTSQFIALESLHKFRHELGTLMHSSEYLAHVATLREESRDVVYEVSCLISDHRFWDRISYYLKLIEPLVQVLRMVDGEDKNDMGYLYEAMDKVKERLREKHPMTFQKWWRIIDTRWESTLHYDLHTAVVGYVIQLDYKTGQRNPLARIAIRILSQTTSSSQCERNWSTFSLIHTKVRNKLSATRLEKLVYCHYNM
ncbi:hypothetical protein Taro_016478 [Colocasia esculenta]|uniref:HAT C-terminal dimerisation domain-containing protein n=1 Tax=Colocasia esculenta TaxID=4460 RepID=A0A843UQE4_COLES|nr:hypothetical protein [Colocasia esculenta]